MASKSVAVVVGCRPNFVKATPLISELTNYCEVRTIHTGQHYDSLMSQVFLDDLGIGEPDYRLDPLPDSGRDRMSMMIEDIGMILARSCVDATVVVGDVDSTLAAAIASNQIGLPVAHLEAGLRSNDWTMPEEMNRYMVDHIASLHLVTEPSAHMNLKKEGIEGWVMEVGNTMIDSLRMVKDQIYLEDIFDLGYAPQSYYLGTFHRKSLLASFRGVEDLMIALNELPLPVVVPAHPNLLHNMRGRRYENVHLLQPLPYQEFVTMMMNAKAVITDSGGVQEETTSLGVPCVTYRNNTERPITTTQGTNIVSGVNPERMIECVLNHDRQCEPFSVWDGYAARRAAAITWEWIK